MKRNGLKQSMGVIDLLLGVCRSLIRPDCWRTVRICWWHNQEKWCHLNLSTTEKSQKTKQFINPTKQNSKENENRQNKTLKKRHEPLELLYCHETK
jgi:hypothetical protein